MQLLLKLMQYLLRDLSTKETASAQLMDQKDLLPMRFALVRAGIRRRAIWSTWCKPILEKSVLLSSPEWPDGNRNRDPGEIVMKGLNKKPLQQQISACYLLQRGRFGNHIVNSATTEQSGNHT